MTVKEIKEFLENKPDDMKVVIHEGDYNQTYEIGDIHEAEIEFMECKGLDYLKERVIVVT